MSKSEDGGGSTGPVRRYGICTGIRGVLEMARIAALEKDHQTLEHVFAAGLQIYKQQSKSKDFSLLKSNTTIAIDEYGNMTVCDSRRVRAGQTALHMVLHELSGDQSVKHFSDVAIAVKCDEPDCQATWIPIRNRDQKKDMLLFFLPELVSGHERDYQLNWGWPRAWPALLKWPG